MTDARPNALGQALRSFLAEELPHVRSLSRHTIRSFRDTLKLLLVFLAGHLQRSAATLDFPDLSRQHLLAFLLYLERERGNSAATRNVRLAALHSFARYAAPLFPLHCGVCQVILAIPFKRCDQRTVEYLEHNEMQALLAAPDRSTPAGLRDHVLLLTMYNTAARVQEILDLRPCDLQLERPRQALLHGKGGKQRYCPLWQETAALLRELIGTLDCPADTQPLFRNLRGQPLTRSGVRHILAKHTAAAAHSVPTLARKRVHPHVLRHTAASHFLQAGVDLVTIGRWLGHASVSATSVYAEIDLEAKRQAVSKAKPLLNLNTDPASGNWRSNADLLSWLESL